LGLGALDQRFLRVGDHFTLVMDELPHLAATV